MEQKFGEVKLNIIKVLSDGKSHSINDIHEEVNKLVGKEVSKSNICTSISQLVNKEGIINRQGVGQYKLINKEALNLLKETEAKEKTVEKKELQMKNEITIGEVINYCELWQEQLNDELSYSMSKEKFISNGKIIELNKKYISDLKKIFKKEF